MVPATSWRRQRQTQQITQCLLNYTVHNIAIEHAKSFNTCAQVVKSSINPGLSPHLLHIPGKVLPSSPSLPPSHLLSLPPVSFSLPLGDWPLAEMAQGKSTASTPLQQTHIHPQAPAGCGLISKDKARCPSLSPHP